MTRIRIRKLHSKLAEAGGYNSFENTGYILESVVLLPLFAISVVNTALIISCALPPAPRAADAARARLLRLPQILGIAVVLQLQCRWPLWRQQAAAGPGARL